VLSAHIDAVCHDPHTEVAYFEDDQLAEQPALDPAVKKQREEKRYARALAANFDFAEPKRLEGNIALLRFDSFHPAAHAAPFVGRTMSDVANADALIIDLRANGGGAADLIPILASYLFDETPVHLYDQISRRDGTHIQAWTDPAVPGKRFGSRKPVYVLTSKETFSAAENLAYTLQQLKRARVVGERTPGGAHGAFGKPVTSHLVPMVATKRTIHAVTKSDWHRVGVVPDLPVAAADALDAAVAAARAELARGR
jgi:C-terminal processing protease CtpA/Prc